MINIVENDFNELKLFLESKEKEVEIQYNGMFNTIWFLNNDELDVYIRGSVTDYLTIARMSVTDKHCGVGTEILQILKKIAKLKGFKGIEIESVCTEAMSGFCKKHNFEKYLYSGMEMDNTWYGNYRLNKI